MPTLHVFLAHPKSVDESQIEALTHRLLASVRPVIARASPGTEVAVVTGRDDFMARSASEGGWDAWCSSVACGMAYRGNVLQPRFDAIVIAPSPLFGKGTARIVADALKVRKPVYFLRENGALLPVVNLVEHDPNDYQNGWSVQVQGNG